MGRAKNYILTLLYIYNKTYFSAIRAFFKLCLKVVSEISDFNSLFRLFQIFTPLYSKVLCPDLDLKRGISRLLLFLVLQYFFF